MAKFIKLPAGNGASVIMAVNDIRSIVSNLEGDPPNKVSTTSTLLCHNGDTFTVRLTVDECFRALVDNTIDI